MYSRRKHLTFAILSGQWCIAFLVLFFFFLGAGIYRSESKMGPAVIIPLLIFFSLGVLIFYGGFLSGFAAVGQYYRVAWLRRSTYFLIITMLILAAFVMSNTAKMTSADVSGLNIPARIFCVALILFGIGILMLKPHYGLSALWCGWLIIISGVVELLQGVSSDSFLGVFFLFSIPVFFLQRKILRKSVQSTSISS